MSTLDVPPGHYSLRVAGHGVQTGQTGSVFLDIDVPKFEDEKLWIGGLALTSKPAALAITAGGSPGVLNLPAPPTTARTFIRGDVITLSAGVSTPKNFTTGTLQLTVHPQETAESAKPSLFDRTIEVASRDAAEQPRAWVLVRPC